MDWIQGTKDAASGELKRLAAVLQDADAVVVGAGAGLSTAAGYTYSGERFWNNFADFAHAFGIRDMYSGGFYPFPTEEHRWAWWSRHIYLNRYVDIPKPTYSNLLKVLQDKDFFVITTNVDHCFQKAGFPKERLFYTQGDYGLLQCATPCTQETYDNEEQVIAMIRQQENMRIPEDLVPVCPRCGGPMTTNLRCDETFVEDEGWHEAANRYHAFLDAHTKGSVLYLELGVGGNTPGIIKYPFIQRAAANPQAAYACLNLGEAFAPSFFGERAFCIDGDLDELISMLMTELDNE